MPQIDGQLRVVHEERGCYRIVRPLAMNRKDRSVMVYVSAGEFEMGDGKESDCPKRRVYLDGFWIGVYCVTNRQYAKFVAETKHRAPEQANYGTPVWKSGRCPEEELDHPVVCVDWNDSVAYAKWAGCGLATEAQWEKAARGPKGLIYPWGNEWEESRCRNYKNKGSEETAAVWGYGKGGSGWGTYNQSGNVWEWCSDWYEGEYYGKSPGKNPTGPSGGSHRLRRGGCWWSDDASRFRGARRDWRAPSHRDGSRGFRLVRTAA